MKWIRLLLNTSDTILPSPHNHRLAKKEEERTYDNNDQRLLGIDYNRMVFLFSMGDNER